MDTFLCKNLRDEPQVWVAGDGTPTESEFLQQCRHHGVAALLFQIMHKKPDWQTWPENIRQQLERDAKSAVAQELHRTHQLQKLLKAFCTNNIQVLVTKGEALARTHYPFAGVRSRCDSDLFIGMGDIEKVRQVVAACGFVIDSPIYKTHQFTVKTESLPDLGYEIDIHWRILNSPRFARTMSFEEAYAESIELDGLDGARALSDQHALILACMHRMGSEWHDQDRLIWLYDIHMLAHRVIEAEWRCFAALAVERNVQSVCLKALNAAKQQLGTEIPGAILDLLQLPEKQRRFADSYLALLVNDMGNLPTASARLDLMHELFMPSGDSLMRKYHKTDRRWLPVLYARQVIGGLAQRLMLR